MELPPPRSCTHKKGTCYTCLRCAYSNCEQFCTCINGPNRKKPTAAARVIVPTTILSSTARPVPAVPAPLLRRNPPPPPPPTTKKRQRQESKATSRPSQQQLQQKQTAKTKASTKHTITATTSSKKKATDDSYNNSENRATQPKFVRIKLSTLKAHSARSGHDNKRHTTKYLQPKNHRHQHHGHVKHTQQITTAYTAPVVPPQQQGHGDTNCDDDNDNNNSDNNNNSSQLQKSFTLELGIVEISEKIHFHDIIGHDHVKSKIMDILHELIAPNQQNRTTNTTSNKSSLSYSSSSSSAMCSSHQVVATSIFLFGPNGCGKTQLARAIAGEANAAILTIVPSDILGMSASELENAAHSIFKRAQECATRVESKRVVLFFDDIHVLGQFQQDKDNVYDDEADAVGCGLGRQTRSILAELFLPLHEISHLAQQNRKLTDPYLLIVGAANCRAEFCDPVIERCFGAHLHLELPFENDRKEILTHYLSEFDNTIAESELLSLIEWTDGWSGLDLRNLTHEAATINAKRQLQGDGKVTRSSIATRPVSITDFEDAIVSRRW